jgi:hypothetical protein
MFLTRVFCCIEIEIPADFEMPADDSELEGRTYLYAHFQLKSNQDLLLVFVGEGNDALNANRKERWTDLGLDHFGQS